MGTLFCAPLCCIALFESHFDHRRLQDFASLTEEPDDYSPADEDPEPCTQSDDLSEGDEEGQKISIASFAQLKKALPNLTMSLQAEILFEVRDFSSATKTWTDI